MPKATVHAIRTQPAEEDSAIIHRVKSASYDAIEEQIRQGIFDLQGFATAIRLILQSESISLLDSWSAPLSEHERREIAHGLHAIETIAEKAHQHASDAADEVEQLGCWITNGRPFDDPKLASIAALEQECCQD